MNIRNLIEKKSNGELDLADFESFSKYISGNRFSEKLVLEFLEALEQKGCSDQEIYNFALAMAMSGKMLNLSEKLDFCVDKYNVGKYSDGMSLILMSVLSSVGIKFARVMTDAGQYGTKLGRLKSIEGFDVPKTVDEAVHNANTCGAFFLNHVGKIAPNALTLYEICSNNGKFFETAYISIIMANKIAIGASVLLADIKVGEGAAIKNTQKFAERLARVGKIANIKTISVVTDLNCPVSASVGTKCELQEAVDFLSGSKDHNKSNLLELAKEMVVCVLMSTKHAQSRSKAIEIFEDSLSSGKAYRRFCQIVETYGGKLSSIGRISSLIDIAVSYITAPSDGYVSNIKLDMLYSSANAIISDGKTYDKGAGVVLMCDEGDKVVQGQKIAKVFYSFSNKRYFDVAQKLQDSFEISKEKKAVNKLLYKVVI